jgi:glutathione S-transferase
MIELYTWSTPNGQKASIMLEEVGLPYRVHPIDIGKDHQFHPDFLAIAPNNKIPAIVDTDNGLHLMESGAILLYLADKTGMLWPQDFPTKWRVVEWLMWQMGGPGPFLGQVHHFVKFNPGKSTYAEERYTKEARRLWGVLDRRLGENGVCGWRLFHRRYRHLAVDFPVRMANRHLRRLPECQALVPRDRGPAFGAKGMERAAPRRWHSYALIGS